MKWSCHFRVLIAHYYLKKFANIFFIYPLTPHQVLWILCWKNCKVCFIFWPVFLAHLFCVWCNSCNSRNKKDFCLKKKKGKKLDLSLRLYFRKVRIVKKLDFHSKKEKIFYLTQQLLGEKMTRKSIKIIENQGEKNQKTKNVSEPLLIPTFCPYWRVKASGIRNKEWLQISLWCSFQPWGICNIQIYFTTSEFWN